MDRLMRIALFYHSLVSDWNHGNAHFLRGVASELLALGHRVRVWEQRDGWSRRHLLAEHGRGAITAFHRAYPGPQLETLLHLPAPSPLPQVDRSSIP